MKGEEHYRKLERMYLQAPVNEYFDPRISIGKGVAEVSIDVRRDFFHAANAVHGYLYFKLLDDATFFAASSLVRDVFVLTVSFNLHFTRPVTRGTMTSVGTVVHQSRRLLVADGLVTDGRGREVGRGTGTFMHSEIALAQELGYA